MHTKYNEIFKLKSMLETEKIPFDWVEGWGYDKEETKIFKEIAPDLMEHYQICYPKGSFINCENRLISVIEGFGTYGAEQDKLEIMGLLKPNEGDGTVAGWLTAKNVFERIKKEENKR